MVRRHERTRLRDVLAEHLAKGRVQQVGGSMVGDYVSPAISIYGGPDRRKEQAGLDKRCNLVRSQTHQAASTLLELDVVPDEAHLLPRVSYRKGKIGADDGACVAHLSARLSVKRRPV